MVQAERWSKQVAELGRFHGLVRASERWSKQVAELGYVLKDGQMIHRNCLTNATSPPVVVAPAAGPVESTGPTPGPAPGPVGSTAARMTMPSSLPDPPASGGGVWGGAAAAAAVAAAAAASAGPAAAAMDEASGEAKLRAVFDELQTGNDKVMRFTRATKRTRRCASLVSGLKVMRFTRCRSQGNALHSLPISR